MKKNLWRFGLASSAVICLSGLAHFANSSQIHLKLSQLKNLLAANQNSANCGSSSGGPQDDPIINKYGKLADSWTDTIKWKCVYNINDFQGDTTTDRFNSARDAATANGGGIVYFPAGTYEFADHIYLKNGVVIRGESPAITDAKLNSYSPATKFVFPKYEPTFSGRGTPNSTAFKKILTTSPNTDSNIGVVNVDLNRAGIYLLGNIDSGVNKNIVIYGVRSNNVADPKPTVPDLSFQAAWLRYCHPFTANIKINAAANVLISNNRLNDDITDNYQQPNYQVVASDSQSIVTYSEGWKVPFDYANHYGIVVNRSKIEGAELNFKLAADPSTEPGLFRRGIVIRDNWIYHKMRAGIRAAGDGLVIQDNEIRDKPVKQWWTDARGTGQPIKNITYENRAIDWAGWNVLIQGNDYQVYRHRLMNSKKFSVDGEGILIQECCGGTKVNNVTIKNNTGNSFIGLFWTPFIQNVRIVENNLLSDVADLELIYVHADTNKSLNTMYNVQIENNIVNGSVLLQTGVMGSGNMIKNNTGNHSGYIKYSCSVSNTENTGFKIQPCLKSN